VRLTLANNKTLVLSPDHFVPVVAATKGSVTMMRSKDVVAGMYMLSVASRTVESGVAVIKTERGVERGLYNPYTMNGFIVVDGVVASSHSAYLLDGVMDRQYAADCSGA
jgi:hypothetical protein